MMASKPHSDRLADIRLKWVQTYNAMTDNDPRTAAMRGDIRWLVEQLEAHQAFLAHVSDWRLDKAIELVRSDLPIEGVMRERLLGRLLNIRDHADSISASSLEPGVHENVGGRDSGSGRSTDGRAPGSSVSNQDRDRP